VRKERIAAGELNAMYELGDTADLMVDHEIVDVAEQQNIISHSSPEPDEPEEESLDSGQAEV
jgi:hypothetical protein